MCIRDRHRLRAGAAAAPLPSAAAAAAAGAVAAATLEHQAALWRLAARALDASHVEPGGGRGRQEVLHGPIGEG
eukprot:11589290-Alexandrium_andersonii.AAC.1